MEISINFTKTSIYRKNISFFFRQFDKKIFRKTAMKTVLVTRSFFEVAQYGWARFLFATQSSSLEIMAYLKKNFFVT